MQSAPDDIGATSKMSSRRIKTARYHVGRPDEVFAVNYGSGQRRPGERSDNEGMTICGYRTGRAEAEKTQSGWYLRPASDPGKGSCLSPYVPRKSGNCIKVETFVHLLTCMREQVQSAEHQLMMSNGRGASRETLWLRVNRPSG